jgi:hypothetical protein
VPNGQGDRSLRPYSWISRPGSENKKAHWPETASEPAKLVPPFADRRCHMVSVTDTYGCILAFLDRATRIKKNHWPEFASALKRPSDCHLPAKLVPTFADTLCRVVSVTDPYCRILGLLDRAERI